MANGLFNLKQVMQAVQQSAWVAQKTPAVEYLVVAGGGGAGEGGGGGGGGGLLQGIAPVPNGQTLVVTVGGGGAGGTSSASGFSGVNSVFGAMTAIGGGGGGTFNTSSASIMAGLNGGSGGGGASIYGSLTAPSGGQGTSGQGNAGGTGDVSNGQPYAGGGGGGAGVVGFNVGSTVTAINNSGGAGIASAISGTLTAYAGGGSGFRAGGAYQVYGVGGVGGGGNQSVAGATNTGGGGGSYNPGTSGGSGIVIVSYPDVYAAATTVNATASTSGSGSTNFNGSGQYLAFASNAVFAFGTGDFTVEFWMYSGTSPTGAADRIYRTGDNNATGNLQIIVASGSVIRVDSGASTLLTGSVNVANSAWHHVAVTRSGTVLTLFIDGTQDTAVTNTTNFTTQIPQIAYDTAIGSGSEYTGYLTNLRVVKGVCVYTGTFTPSTIPLQATQSAGTNIAAITGTQTSLLLNAVSGAWCADSSVNSSAPTNATSTAPTWNQLSPFTGTGYKNRVYTWTTSGTITF